MELNYYTYKEATFTCTACGWSGLGKDAPQGEMFRECYEINCPKCRKPLLAIMFPTYDEVLQFGSEEERKGISASQRRRERYQAQQLKSPDQLPDLPYPDITVVMREVKEPDEDYIVFTVDGQEIWRELRWYEYYERYFEICEIFKQKYNLRLIDVVPDVGGIYLYGDWLASPTLVSQYRSTMRTQFDQRQKRGNLL